MCAFPQSRAEDVVIQIRLRLGERRDRKAGGGGAAAETGELRKDEPDPVTALGSGPQFGDDRVVNRCLGVDEPLQVEDVGRRRALVRGVPRFRRGMEGLYRSEAGIGHRD